MADGHDIRAPLVISNAGVINTFERLMPESEAKRIGYPHKREHIKPSKPHIGLYLGLKGTPEQLGLPRTNFWIYPGADHDGNVERFLQNRSEEHTSELQSRPHLVCRLLLEKKKKQK